LLAVVDPPDESRPPRDGGARRATSPDGLDAARLSDFVGGRALAWLGGIATLLGIGLLLALAIAHGWIGHEARVAMAAVGCLALMAGGIWLHARRGRTEAAVVMVAVGTAGWFATAIVASEGYRLIAPAVAVAAVMLGGAGATVLAIRWAGRAIAALGLIGALGTPILLGAPEQGTLIAMLAGGAACAMTVVLWQRWLWLAFATVLVCAPQWTGWLIQGHGTAASLAVLGAFASLGLTGAVISQARGEHDDRMLRSAAALALLNATIVAVAGRLTLGATVGACWLAAVAVAHIALGARRWPRLDVVASLRRLLVAIGVIVGDAALALGLHGLVLSAAWSASALLLAWVGRRIQAGEAGGPWLEVGLGAQISLLLTRTLLDVPPAQLSGAPQLVSLVAVAILAATCLGCSRVAAGPRSLFRLALEGLGLLAIGYLTAATLEGPVLVAAWALEAVALGQVHRRGKDPAGWYAALAFLAAAGAYALATMAPPTGLVLGVDDLAPAAVSLAVVGVGAAVVGARGAVPRRHRVTMLAGAGLAGLYLASLAIITAFQPGAGSQSDLVLELSVRQQGQVLLSGLWVMVGLFGLILALQRDITALRYAALALMLVTVAKVFLYDLSTLTSIYRVLSCLLLGGFLLVGAFAYQRMRPPAPPDLRTVHPSQR
jgi:uncharacterized membrane protein